MQKSGFSLFSERLQVPLSHSTSSVGNTSSLCDVPSWFRNGQDIRFRDPDSLELIVIETAPLTPGFYSYVLCGNQIRWWLLAQSGSLCPQQIRPLNQVQDGNCEDSHVSDLARRLDGFHRSQGCLLPSARTSGQAQVPAVFFDQPTSPASGAASAFPWPCRVSPR